MCNTLTVQKRSNLNIHLCELPDRNPLILVVVELLEDLVNVFLRLVLLTISLHCHESHLKLLLHSIYQIDLWNWQEDHEYTLFVTFICISWNGEIYNLQSVLIENQKALASN